MSSTASSPSDMTVHTSVELDTPATAAWAVFGEQFGEWAQWSDGIASSSLNGPLARGVMRTNDVPGFGVVTQELTRFDRGTRSLTYEMRSGMPAVLVAVGNAWTIEPLGADRCRLSGDASFGLAWWARPLKPLLRRKMTASLQSFADGFADRMK